MFIHGIVASKVRGGMGGGGPWDIGAATYDNNFKINLWDSDGGIRFNDLGNQLSIASGGFDAVARFDLSVAWDVSTAVKNVSNIEYDFSAQSNAVKDFTFGDAGKKFYVTDSVSKEIYQYNLGTAYALNTAAYANKKITGLPNSSSAGVPSSDGNNFYYYSTTEETIYQRNTSALPWNLPGSASWTIDMSGPTNWVSGISFSPDGKRLYMVNSTVSGGKQIQQFKLTTPFNVSTAQDIGVWFDGTSEISTARGIEWKPDGTRFWIYDDNGRIYSYSTN